MPRLYADHSVSMAKIEKTYNKKKAYPFKECNKKTAILKLITYIGPSHNIMTYRTRAYKNARNRNTYGLIYSFIVLINLCSCKYYTFCDDVKHYL